MIKLKIQYTMISWDEESVNYCDLNAYLYKELNVVYTVYFSIPKQNKTKQKRQPESAECSGLASTEL